MPIKESWLIENRIVYFELFGDVSVEEIAEVSAKFIEMMESSDSMFVHALHDATHLDKLPKSIGALSGATREAWQHPKTGWTVAFNVKNPILAYIGNMMSRIFQTRYRIVSSKQEALALLKSVDPTLDLSEQVAE